MKPEQKQMALKAALLVILAANVGGHLPMFSSNAFNSTDLASGATDARPSGAVASTVPGRTGGPQAEAPVLKVDPPPPPQVGPKPDAPITTTNVNVTESTDYKKICSVDFKIHFVQVKEAGKDVVHAYVTKRFPQETFPGLVEDGTYRDLISDSHSKAQWDDTIRQAAFEKLKNEGNSCDEQASAPQGPQAPQSPTAPDDDDKRIARGVKNCTLDKEGTALTNSQMYTCNLKRLQSISLDKSATDDEDASADPAKRTRARRERRDALAVVLEALRPLERSIKSLLLNKDPDLQDKGADHLDDVLLALNDIKDTASDPSDQRAMTKLIDGLQKAYPLGAKVDHEGDAYAARLSAIDDKVTDLKMSMIGTNQYQQMAINQQIQMLQAQRLNTLQLVNGNGDYLKFRALCQASVIDATDCSDFTNGYSSLLQQVTGGNASMMPGQLQLATSPTDILNLRQQAMSTDPRNYGSQTPIFPQINYQLLGLQNPSLIGGTVPNCATQPSVFPQQSGFPVQQAQCPVTTFGQQIPTTQFPQAQFPMNNSFAQPSVFSQQPMTFPQQPSVFSQQPMAFPQQPGVFPNQQPVFNQQSIFPTQTSTFPQPAGTSMVPGRIF